MSINAIAAETLTVTAADITADAITTEKATETDAATAVKVTAMEKVAVTAVKVTGTETDAATAAIRSNIDVASAGVHLGGIAGSL